MTIPPTTLIGIDCACQPKQVGLARGIWRVGRRPRVTDVLLGSEILDVVDQVAAWVKSAERCLLALDAPLGWPEAMGRELTGHHAGNAVSVESNLLFRRETDRNVYQRFRKTPLDIGADRIARTAVAALRMLNGVRQRTGHSIPLSWDPARVSRTAAIEVYPAGTLLAHGFPAKGYKKPDQHKVRAEILARIDPVLCLPKDRKPMLANADRLDAVVCILAGVDFLNGCADPPADFPTARREGWIWVRSMSL